MSESWRNLLLGRKSFWNPKHPFEHLRWAMGRLGVWLCDRYYPRPCTQSERASSLQYVRCVIAYMEMHGGHNSASTNEWFMRQYQPWLNEHSLTDKVQ